MKKDDKAMLALSELSSLQRDELFERIIDALMDEDIAPELKAEIQRHIRSQADERRFEKAFLGYADKLKPYEGRLEGEALASYNRLAARLGLRQILPDIPATGSQPEPLRKPRRLPIYLRVAAVLVPVLVAAGIWSLMDRSPYDKEVVVASASHVRQTLLPDSTHIYVEAGSSVVYRETAGSRDVELSGKAFFKVKRDTLKPFHVSTGNMHLSVLGTQFRMSDNPAMVSLFEGSVSVEAGETSRTLSWGERLTYDPATGKTDISIIPSGEMIAEGYKPRLKFNRSSLGEVLDALAASFEVDIVTAPDVNRAGGKLTLDLENMTLPEAVGFLIKVSREDLSFTSADGVVNITKK